MSFKKIALSVVCTLMMAMVISTVTASAEETNNNINNYSEYITMSPASPAEQAVSVCTTSYVPTVEEQYVQVIQPETCLPVVTAAPVKEEIEGVEYGSDSSDEESYTKAELRLMSSIIYCEAGGESYAGKLAVGIVVMNRVSSSSFPDTIHGVIYQRRQFSPVRNGALRRALANYDAGKFTSKQEKASIKAAKAALTGAKAVQHKGKKKSISKYKFFSRYIPRAKYKIGGHMFK